VLRKPRQSPKMRFVRFLRRTPLHRGAAFD